jgi:hypothetical protein
MKKCLYFVCLILYINYVKSQNATDCMEMYMNKTTDTPCLTDRSCCLIQYSNYNQNFTKCLLKLNETEDLCDNLSDVISFYTGSMTLCECASSHSNIISSKLLNNILWYTAIYYLFFK